MSKHYISLRNRLEQYYSSQRVDAHIKIVCSFSYTGGFYILFVLNMQLIDLYKQLQTNDGVVDLYVPVFTVTALLMNLYHINSR